MSRLARVVIPGCPHHVIQRGNRRQRAFFCDEDRIFYLRLLKKYGDDSGIKFWAYCLMDNHVHLIAVPEDSDSLARGIGRAHWKYALSVNFREDWKGCLWQDRFFSCPLGGRYIFAAVRYVELNPVRAGIALNAADYPWSSARFHVYGTPDTLISGNPYGIERRNWTDFLNEKQSDSDYKSIRTHVSTGRPLGEQGFVEELEKLTGRVLREKGRGRKVQSHGGGHGLASPFD